ncbi:MULTISPECIES: TetR/AcrR family transcriptional regulator [unclassified Streptomyces]|uniref:TetR/AcrR family transcriptional regulator n=1 Tax=unclassified Streptomyces TaxID=2593676 RepID=UPI0018FE89F5|nr:helix-turn-helix domain-containing protein [Streptomyces sp. CB01580]
MARRASIAKSALFYHFKNKDELLHAVVDDLYALAAQEIVKEMATVDGPQQALSSAHWPHPAPSSWT